MKSWMAGVLLVSLVSGTTCAVEFFKIPFLISHYFDHREEAGDMSFLTFLVIHYVNDSNEKPDNDYREDHQLPFKTHEVINIQTVSLTRFNRILFIKEYCNFDYCQFKEVLLPLDSGSEFWNPPRG